MGAPPARAFLIEFHREERRSRRWHNRNEETLTSRDMTLLPAAPVSMISRNYNTNPVIDVRRRR